MNDENIIYGKNSILEAINSSVPINRVRLRDSLRKDSTIKGIIDGCKSNNIPFDFVSNTRLKSISNNARDVVAFVSPISYTGLDIIINRIGPQSGIVVLDQISDPQNLGAIIRSAECLGMDAVIIPKRSACPITATVTRASSGAVMHIPIVRTTNISQIIETLKERGFWVYGTAPEAKRNLGQCDFSDRSVLVIGSEGRGIRPSVRKHCDMLINIPMKGNVNSLNASVSAGIVMYKLSRRFDNESSV
jgi:23S rRNA (guanosine2251-2'-O)-methyltransferase